MQEIMAVSGTDVFHSSDTGTPIGHREREREPTFTHCKLHPITSQHVPKIEYFELPTNIGSRRLVGTR